MVTKKQVYFNGRMVDWDSLSPEDREKQQHLSYLDKIEKRVAHQFFVDRKSVEWLAEAYRISKANVLYCITELSHEFGEALTINRRSNRYRINR